MVLLTGIIPPLPPDIELVGVRTNNLRDLRVRFPKGKMTVVTGVSGSGKSSLVFDTLYAEAYRRYVESLSSFARQYLKALPRPAVQEVRGLPPAIAVQQSRSGATNRSTVGTATELDGLLRILFGHLATIMCRKCGAPVRKDTPESIAAAATRKLEGKRILVTAPLDRVGKIAAKELKAQLEAQGFSRLLLKGSEGSRVIKVADAKAADLKAASLVIDRISVTQEAESRLAEAARLALRAGRGFIELVEDVGEVASRPHPFSSALECPTCRIEYAEPSAELLSFNHPLGACSSCQGFGHTSDVDWDKVIPDRSKSLKDKGVAAWNFGAFAEYYDWAKDSAKRQCKDFALPFERYGESDWAWLRRGDGPKFDGIDGFFEYLESKRYKPHYRIHAARFRRYVVCALCDGNRLNEKALACVLRDKNLADVSRLTIAELGSWLTSAANECAAKATVSEALDEAHARLRYLEKIGLGYLALSRSARTLSGGELQRISMARCLGSALTDTLFCLDEPTAGLHARDSQNLLEVVRELRDQGNTVVMVEHEQQLIEGADHLLEIGPRAGRDGGALVYAGDPLEWRAKHLGDLAAGLKERAVSPSQQQFLQLKGARTHNLKGVTVKFPLGKMSAVCGVSGSGKTSLVQHTLYPLLAKALKQPIDRTYASEPLADEISPSSAISTIDEVMLVSQVALSRSSRSNIATYLGLMDDIRKGLAAEPLAKKLGLSAGAFSFNTPGGRCETCRGLGTVVEDLSFLGEMEVTCAACEGRRFGDSVLSVELRGKNLLDILRLTVAEAREFFFDRPQVVATADAVIGMGLGYLTLGQSTSSFSGGEAQRLKLIALMGVAAASAAKPSCLIFDEPTTGLSDVDVANLLVQLRRLVDKGHTVIIVEHHLKVLRAVDWLIEIGPEAAARGGELVYEGPPDGIREVERSVTRPYLVGSHKSLAGSHAIKSIDEREGGSKGEQSRIIRE